MIAGPRGFHGLAVGLVAIGVLTESDVPFLVLALLFVALGVSLLAKGRRRTGVILVVGPALLLGYLAWGWASRPPRTRMEVTEAFAAALVEADWERGRELVIPGERAWAEPVFRGFGQEFRALGVRVEECEDSGWQTGCWLEGGARYQAAVLMSLQRTEEGWRVTAFMVMPMGDPHPEGAAEAGGGSPS